MRAYKYVPQYTVEDYRLWKGDWELIDGYPHAMTPSANFRHQEVAGEVHSELRQKIKGLKETCANCTVVYELDWVVNEDTVLRPDIAVVCNQTEKFITQPPVIIVEVLSTSTALKDRHLKYEIYEEQGVPYYIIVDPETKHHNIFVLTDGRYLEQNETTLFSISNTCSIQLPLQEILGSI